MWEDPIVAEVHRNREALAAKFNFDVAAFFADIRKRQASLGARLVPLEEQTKIALNDDAGHHFGSSGAAPSEPAPAV